MSAKEPSKDRRLSRGLASASELPAFLLYCLRRFQKDGGSRQAASLSYASLLALVPLLAIALAVLTAFPAFLAAEQAIKESIFSLLSPQGDTAFSEHFDAFLANARGLTGPGIIGLSVTAVLLLANVNGALNQIWRVSAPRPLVWRFLIYWALLTLGPMMIGASISLSSWAFAQVQFAEQALPFGFRFLSKLFALLLASLGLAGLYFIVPNRAVKPAHALAGGAVAAVLLELLKSGFGFYLSNFPSYQLVYGALAALPIFLVWLYLVWAAILLGAELSASLPEWGPYRQLDGERLNSGDRLALAMTLLALLRQAAQSGRGLKEGHLQARVPAPPHSLDSCLKDLRDARWISRGPGGRYQLSRDLRSVSVCDLLSALQLTLEPKGEWAEEAGQLGASLAAQSSTLLQRSLDDVLSLQADAATKD